MGIQHSIRAVAFPGTYQTFPHMNIFGLVWFFTLACFGFFFPQRKTPKQAFCIVSVNISQGKVSFHSSARETGRNPGGDEVQRYLWMYRPILSLHLGADTGAELRLLTSEVFRKCFYINFPCVVLYPRGNM